MRTFTRSLKTISTSLRKPTITTRLHIHTPNVRATFSTAIAASDATKKIKDYLHNHYSYAPDLMRDLLRKESDFVVLEQYLHTYNTTKAEVDAKKKQYLLLESFIINDDVDSVKKLLDKEKDDNARDLLFRPKNSYEAHMITFCQSTAMLDLFIAVRKKAGATEEELRSLREEMPFRIKQAALARAAKDNDFKKLDLLLSNIQSSDELEELLCSGKKRVIIYNSNFKASWPHLLDDCQSTLAQEIVLKRAEKAGKIKDVLAVSWHGPLYEAVMSSFKPREQINQLLDYARKHGFLSEMLSGSGRTHVFDPWKEEFYKKINSIKDFDWRHAPALKGLLTETELSFTNCSLVSKNGLFLKKESRLQKNSDGDLDCKPSL